MTKLHSVGFEPTSTNTLALEASPLDGSGTNADLLLTNDYHKSNKLTCIITIIRHFVK